MNMTGSSFRDPHRALALAGCLAVALTATTALGQGNETAKAQALFEQARAAMDQNDYAVACEDFRQSDELDPALGTKLNLANCEERRGHAAVAWSLLGRVLAVMPQDDPRRPYAEQRVRALEPLVSHLKIVAAPNAPRGLRVRVAGRTLDTNALGDPIALDPGDYRVEVEIPGRPPRSLSVGLRPTQVLEVVVPKDVDSASGNARRGEPRETSTRTTGGDGRETIALVLGGAGVAGVIVGSITGLIGLHQESIGNANCNDRTRTCNQLGFDANQTARTMATVSTVSFVVGALGLGAGGYFYLSANAAHHSQAHRTPEVFVAYRGNW